MQRYFTLKQRESCLGLCHRFLYFQTKKSNCKSFCETKVLSPFEDSWRNKIGSIVWASNLTGSYTAPNTMNSVCKPQLISNHLHRELPLKPVSLFTSHFSFPSSGCDALARIPRQGRREDTTSGSSPGCRSRGGQKLQGGEHF